MPKAKRCPGCHSSLPPGEDATLCPFCGADLDARESQEPPAESRPRKRKRHRSSREPDSFDFVGLLRAAAAALLLLAVSAGFAAVLHLTVDNGAVVAGPAPAGPLPVAGGDPPVKPAGTSKQPAPPIKPDKSDKPGKPETWQARPDPAALPAPALDFPPGPGIAMNGNPLFSSGDARFVVDTPEYGLNFNTELHAKEAPWIPVHDLSSQKSIGAMAKAAPRGRMSVLSPDGRHLVTQALLQKQGPVPVAVWELDKEKPTFELAVPGGVFWMDFISPDDLVVQCGDADGYRLQIWSISKQQVGKEFGLSPQAIPLAKNSLRSIFQPDRLSGALSPGRNYLALRGDNGIALFALVDGRCVGLLPLPAGRHKTGYVGLRFSEDGSELFAVVNVAHQRGARSTRLMAWDMTDGSTSRDVVLANPNLQGPPLPGPEPGTVLLRSSRFDGNKSIPLGHVVDAGSGKTLVETPYTPVRWLADHRLLAVGPLENAPAARGVCAVTIAKAKS
jgi:hypothetical protein